MLDDLDYIARFDSQNALAVAAGAAEQLLYDEFTFEPTGSKEISSIVLTGMGGSALAGLLLRDWLEAELKVPFIITRDYSLPSFVDEKSLVFVSSYSGNTEETISALNDAEGKGAQIIILTSGGKLADIAKAKNYPLLLLPSGLQPRMSSNFSIKLLSTALSKLGLIDEHSRTLEGAHQQLVTSAKSYGAKVLTSENQAKQIAESLVGKSVVVYGSPLLSSAAYKWKININENAKNLAFYNQLPEFNHNEFVGWTGKPVEKPYAVVELSTDQDHAQIQKRFSASNKLLSGNMPKPIEIKAEGKNALEQILWTVQLGDFVSIYLAVLNQINPTPVELIEKLKKELN